MSDAQSMIVGLKAQECPGGGWNGMPAELEGRATVADCLAHGGCGCIYGCAAQHIERLLAALAEIAAHDDQFSSAGQARAMRDRARAALADTYQQGSAEK